MKLAYIAGPYRAATGWGIERNIMEARMVAAQVAALGLYPVTPHANTAHFDGIQPDSFWLEGGLKLLAGCDCAIFFGGWRQSDGSRAELEECRTLGIPVFRWPENPDTVDREWIRAFAKGEDYGQGKHPGTPASRA